jgi:hypothetical protein
MPTRSLYPEGVEVHQVDLTRESSSRIADTMRRNVDTSEMGVVSGLAISINVGNNQLIDISAGSGYALNGDLITVPIAQTAISLIDTVANHTNLVVLFYTEAQSLPEAHEDLGQTFNTMATAAFRVVVMTPSAYAALPSSAADLSSNAKDRSLIVGQVVATGGALTTTSIINASTWPAILGVAKQPTVTTGVFIVGMSASTSAGSGTLAFSAGTPGTLTWTAPGDTAGTPVSVPVDGTYTLRSANTAYTLTVSVTVVGLPTISTSDAITVTSLYTMTVPGFSANDNHHRHLLGSGVPTPTNPHGMTLADIGGANNFSVKDHQNNMHAVGIEPASDASFLSMSIVGTTPNSLNIITATSIGGININGLILNSTSSIPLPASPYTLTFTDVTDITQTVWEIYVTASGAVGKNKRVLFPPGSALQSSFKIVDISDDVPAGAHNLAYNVTNHTLQYDGGPIYTLNQLLSSQVIKMMSADRKSFIRVWYNGTSLPGANLTEALTTYATQAGAAVFAMVTFFATVLGYTGTYWDRRVYGNIDKVHLTSRALEDLIRRYRSYVYPTQVVLDGLEAVSAGTGAATINSGRIIRDGTETYISGVTLTFTDGDWYVYIDEAGILQKVLFGGTGGLFGANTKNMRVAHINATGGVITITDWRHIVSDKATNLTSFVAGSDGDIWGSLEAAVALSSSSWIHDASGNLVAILAAAQTIKSNGSFALNITSGASCTWDSTGTITIGHTSGAQISMPSGVNLGNASINTTGIGGLWLYCGVNRRYCRIRYK